MGVVVLFSSNRLKKVLSELRKSVLSSHGGGDGL